MTNSEIISVEGIGEISFERNYKAKYVNISVRPFKGVRVAVPPRVSLTAAKEIVKLKAEWINAQLSKNQRLESELAELIRVLAPIHKTEAKNKITNRLRELSIKHAIPYGKVSIRNQKTRWGSCSAKSNISLNIKIAGLPDHLMDYVILHELVHIRHFNHSKDYWQELDIIVGNARLLDKQLDTYRHMLFF